VKIARIHPGGSPPDLPKTERYPVYEARWDGLALALDDRTLTAIVRARIPETSDIDDVQIRVAPRRFLVEITVRRMGVPLSAKASLSQIRFKDGFLAFVVDELEALSFIPVPDAVIEYFLDKAPAGLLTYYRSDRIMVVNLNPWIPEGLDLTLDDADFLDGEVRLRFAAGRYDLSGLIG
jgi:hypothetical protein